MEPAHWPEKEGAQAVQLTALECLDARPLPRSSGHLQLGFTMAHLDRLTERDLATSQDEISADLDDLLVQLLHIGDLHNDAPEWRGDLDAVLVPMRTIVHSEKER